jgi:dTDP-4-amino-4,6-dideoxygalactose transaminase
MEGMQGAVLGVKLKYLKQWTDLRRNNAQKYRLVLDGLKSIKLPEEMSYAKHVYHLFVIQVLASAKKSGTSLRDELADYLKQNGIFTGLHYPIPLHLQTCFKDLGYKKGDFPVSETLADTCLSLPMYPELSDDKIEFVASKIKEFFSK